MIIEIKYKDQLFKFADWQENKGPNFIHYRQLFTINGEEYEDNIFISIVNFPFSNEGWRLKVYGYPRLDFITEIYQEIHPGNVRYKSADEAKKEIDRFLLRINSLGVFF
jgi:hypothetical protein